MARRRLTVAGADRRREIVEMRTERQPWAVIAARFGISVQRAHQIYLEALDAIPSRAIEVHRAEADQLADEAIRDLLTIARGDSVTPRSRVEAWHCIRAWLERVARMHGVDAERNTVISTAEVWKASPELQERITLARQAIEGARLVVQNTAEDTELTALIQMARRRSENQRRELTGEPPLRDDEPVPERPWDKRSAGW